MTKIKKTTKAPVNAEQKIEKMLRSKGFEHEITTSGDVWFARNGGVVIGLSNEEFSPFTKYEEMVDVFIYNEAEMEEGQGASFILTVPLATILAKDSFMKNLLA